jgi:PAS domain S-box-containing protein
MTPEAPTPESSKSDRLTVEHIAARALLSARSLDEAAAKVLDAICSSMGWEYGAFWAVNAEAARLVCRDSWSVQPDRFPYFDAITRTSRFERGRGLPGRVWATAQPVWIPDVVNDPQFPRAESAAREGLHAAFGFPVVLRGEVISVMEFFSPSIREPDAGLLEMLGIVGSQIGMFLDRLGAQEELDRFFALSLDLICVAGFDGYFKRVNPAWTRVLGHTEAELLSRPYLEFVHPQDVERTIAQASKLNAGHQVVHFENRYRHRDGTHRWLLWTASPFPQQQAVYASARDITDRKAAEQTMTEYAHDLETAHGEMAQLVKELEVAKRHAEEASATRSAFLANMSHEIRTPLSAILGMTGLALATRLTPQQAEYLTTVKSSAEALLGIIDDVLDFSKIEARRLDLESMPFNVRDTVEDAAKLLAVRADDKGLELLIDVHRDVPDVLVGDPGRLRQVLLNIVGNAIKFTAAGEVVVTVALEPGRQQVDQTVLRFSVRDTGIGIARDQLSVVFQAFTQADNSTTRRFGGTGLGLAIAQRLVELMGGTLWVESEINQGSTFSFTAVFEPMIGADLTQADAASLDGLRTLVVDDNATNRRILEEMLRSWRMEAVAVADARAAIDALRAADAAGAAYDVVIADGQMPEIDGFSLAQSIRRDRRLKRVRIIMLTSMGQHAPVARTRRSNIDVYLTKPVKHSDLLDALAAVAGPRGRTTAARAPVEPAAETLRPLRILVAEDNAVNRKLIVTILQRRGHRVTAVENGRQAMEAVFATPGPRPEVLIMDLQMPEMGGLEATRAIRTREQRTGRYLPIVALTAHAMQGDREKCLDAGMDEYLAKPIDVPRLIAAVEQLGAGRPAPAPSVGPAAVPAPATTAVFDEAAALARTGGDRRLLKQIVQLFRTDSRKSMQKIARAAAGRDVDAVRMAAHSLKGSAATIGGIKVREIADALEQRARNVDVDGFEATVAELRAALSALDGALVAAGLVSGGRSAP